MYTFWLSKGKLLFLYVLRETHLCPARLNTGCPFYLSWVTALRPSVLRKAVELFSGNWTHNIQKNMYTVRLLLIIEQCTVHTCTWFSISSTIFIRPWWFSVYTYRLVIYLFMLYFIVCMHNISYGHVYLYYRHTHSFHYNRVLSMNYFYIIYDLSSY